jgi:hypothetical protein
VVRGVSNTPYIVKPYPTPESAFRELTLRHELPAARVTSALTEAAWTEGKWVFVELTSKKFSVKFKPRGGGGLWLVRIRGKSVAIPPRGKRDRR